MSASQDHLIDDPDEVLLWTAMRAFEVLAVRQYHAHAPLLAAPAKSAFVARLCALVPKDDALSSSELAVPVRALLHAADGPDALSALFVQGLLLETLAQVFYAAFASREAASTPSRALAEAGRLASLEASAPAPALITARVERGPQALAAFISATRDVLMRLDALGEAIDARFSERFDLRFTGVMADLTAELMPLCVGELGMDRRKLICHLTGSLMGIG